MTNLPQKLTTWLTEHAADLQTEGINCDLGRSPDDGRSKASTWLTLESETRLATITVWDSGEAELDYADVARGQAHPEHRDLRTQLDVADAVAALLEWVELPTG
ncbi:hypothetical protein MTF65_28065 [Streptomyces sp. APSN-46.1]|uniref:immunity protein TriTu family protein n=1 Tax=Streptomyces sp. APSN-46.1 TaxID=2929049 RepID=UPI001FB3F122|nr:hypothetical protein [Streptomyces sp. APSN-46.1]MCJ1681140.1 hypothetical protein [Streptomyces sp. APSN-46.1]